MTISSGEITRKDVYLYYHREISKLDKNKINLIRNYINNIHPENLQDLSRHQDLKSFTVYVSNKEELFDVNNDTHVKIFFSSYLSNSVFFYLSFAAHCLKNHVEPYSSKELEKNSHVKHDYSHLIKLLAHAPCEGKNKNVSFSTQINPDFHWVKEVHESVTDFTSKQLKQNSLPHEILDNKLPDYRETGIPLNHFPINSHCSMELCEIENIRDFLSNQGVEVPKLPKEIPIHSPLCASIIRKFDKWLSETKNLKAFKDEKENLVRKFPMTYKLLIDITKP